MVSCLRCGQTREGLERAPLPGAIGKAIVDSTCRACWDEWMGEQTKLINERSLTPFNPEHYALIEAELCRFLKLKLA